MPEKEKPPLQIRLASPSIVPQWVSSFPFWYLNLFGDQGSVWEGELYLEPGSRNHSVTIYQTYGIQIYIWWRGASLSAFGIKWPPELELYATHTILFPYSSLSHPALFKGWDYFKFMNFRGAKDEVLLNKLTRAKFFEEWWYVVFFCVFFFGVFFKRFSLFRFSTIFPLSSYRIQVPSIIVFKAYDHLHRSKKISGPSRESFPNNPYETKLRAAYYGRMYVSCFRGIYCRHLRKHRIVTEPKKEKREQSNKKRGRSYEDVNIETAEFQKIPNQLRLKFFKC